MVRVLFDAPLWLLAGMGLHSLSAFMLPAHSNKERFMLSMAVFAGYVFIRAMVTLPLVGK